VLAVATCGLIYELIAGTLASYLLGDSVTQFSLVIGVYLSALGVGAWFSQYLHQGLARTFIEVELALALVGGLSAPLLFVSFAFVQWFQLVLFGSVFVIGTLVGLELPLLMRILKEHLDFSDPFPCEKRSVASSPLHSPRDLGTSPHANSHHCRPFPRAPGRETLPPQQDYRHPPLTQ
jgi:predicted membrane-bound spermidine synthase